MEITQTQSGNVMNVAVSGRLDSYWADHLTETLTDVVRQGRHRIRLDCSKVTFLSSAGIGVLLRFHKELKGIGGLFRVVEPSPAVTAVLRLTKLSDLLVETGAAVEEAVDRSRPIRTRERAGVKLDVYELDAAARLRCRAIGTAEPLATGTFSESQSTSLESIAPAVAVGVGAFGDSFEDCRVRFGELLSVGGTTVYQPADGTNVADYLIGAGALGAQVRVLYCLACDGRFSHLVRFESTQPDAVVGLSALARACLEESGGGSIGLVAVAEAMGLVGAALRLSPVGAFADGDLFAFPGVRSRLAFTAERAFPRSVALVGGVVMRAGAASSEPLVRPLGDGLAGHLHAAAFRFQPVRKGLVELAPTVAALFDAERLLGVLHLLDDDRGPSGAGESEFIRGACWIGRID
jgi:anti-anti-sigma factor